MEKTILAAIDGSAHSANSLDYLAGFFARDQTLSLHLLSVAPSGGGGKDWMFEVDPYRTKDSGSDQHIRKANRHLREAEERLIRGGFARERIQSKSRAASSVSNAIREEAERGSYDSLVIGRRGIGAVGNMLFGSISGDLVRKCGKVPLWIVDGKVQARHVLLAVQSHPASLLAADHLAFMAKDLPEVEIYLYSSNSMFSGQQAAPEEDFHKQWSREWCQSHLDMSNRLLGAHTQILAENGIGRHRIRQVPSRLNLDTGSDVLRQARECNCGTIVLGHRIGGPGNRPLKGLADRALKQAQHIAVWLVG